jgi:hypothetical protein
LSLSPCVVVVRYAPYPRMPGIQASGERLYTWHTLTRGVLCRLLVGLRLLGQSADCLLHRRLTPRQVSLSPLAVRTLQTLGGKYSLKSDFLVALLPVLKVCFFLPSPHTLSRLD